MGRHHEPRSGSDGRPERRELVTVEMLGTPLHDTERVVGVLGKRAQTREVLRRCGHAGRLEATDHRRPMTADRPRVVAERADPERRVLPLGSEIDGRGVDDVDTHRPSLAPDRRTDPLGQGFVVDRTERHVAGELGRLGTKGVELATLLVGRDEEGRGSGGRDRGRAVTPPPAARCRASVSSRTCPGVLTLNAMYRVAPAAGASASRRPTQLGTVSPSKAIITRSRIRSPVTP